MPSLKIFLEKKLLIFFPLKNSALKEFLIFSQKKLFSYFGKRNLLIFPKTKLSNPKNIKISHISGNRTFLLKVLKNCLEIPRLSENNQAF